MEKHAKTILVLPVFNEERYIGEVVNKAKAYVDEVIVVDDGSSDHSFERAREKGAKVVRHPLNLGKSAALKTGAEAAIEEQADIIVFMDSDGQHQAEDLPKFIQMVESGEADLAIGVRVGGDKMPFTRKAGNNLLEWMLKVFYGLSIRDIQSGFRAFKAKDYPKLVWESKGYHADAEITVRAAQKKMQCREVEIKTIYNDPYKGMTLLDGLGLILRVLLWKFRP